MNNNKFDMIPNIGRFNVDKFLLIGAIFYSRSDVPMTWFHDKQEKIIHLWCKQNKKTQKWTSANFLQRELLTLKSKISTFVPKCVIKMVSIIRKTINDVERYDTDHLTSWPKMEQKKFKKDQNKIWNFCKQMFRKIISIIIISFYVKSYIFVFNKNLVCCLGWFD